MYMYSTPVRTVHYSHESEQNTPGASEEKLHKKERERASSGDLSLRDGAVWSPAGKCCGIMGSVYEAKAVLKEIIELLNQARPRLCVSLCTKGTE